MAFGPEFTMLIDGALVTSNVKFEVKNPSTLELVGQAPHASKEQVDAAVEAAARSFPEWAMKSLDDRKEYIKSFYDKFKEVKEELAHLLVKEQGKPLVHAKGETEVCAMLFEHGLKLELPIERCMETETHYTEVHRRPVGVVAGVTPWNFPLFCALQKVIPAVVLGNTFIWKPSPYTPLTALALTKILSEVFPKGVVNVVSGDDKQEFNVGAYLSNHPKVKLVSFTGSVPTGKKIMGCAANDVKRVTLEMGGNDAAIVRQDCDPAEVAPKVFAGAFANTGQICCAIKRCYVHESLYDKFVNEISKAAKVAKVGDGFQEGIEYGPLNNEMQLQKVAELVEDAKTHGGVVNCGGKRLEEKGKGYFYEPTIVSNVKEGVRLVDEEQFGPVLPIIPFKDDAEAIQRANNSNYGLGGSVWSKDVQRANQLAGLLEAGTVWVNDHLSITGGPFGGFKWSGFGRELGSADINAYTEIQTVRYAK